MSNSPGGAFLFTHSSTVPGSLEIGGSLTLAEANLTLQINGTLTLDSSGVLNNPGTVQAGAFLNNGGTVNGNAPIIIGGVGPQSVRISGIELIDRGRVSIQDFPALAALPDAMVFWSAEPQRSFRVQMSHDLVHWSAQEASVIEGSPGFYQACITVQNDRPCYFRLLW